MLTSGRAIRQATVQGQELHPVEEMEHLRSDGVVLRRGELVMVAGCPAQAKSTFMLWWAIQTGEPTLYFSLDMSQHTALARTAAIVTGYQYHSIVKEIAESPEALDFYSDQVSDLPIHWSFASNPTLDTIDLELSAYVEVWDRYPSLLVMDNLMDIESGGEDHGSQQYIMKELHALARRIGACVVVLHHCKEERDSDLTKPPARWAIQNKVDQKPGTILTVAIGPAGDVYRIAAVKLRDGMSYPTASRWSALKADLTRCKFSKLSQYPEGSRNA